MHICILNEDNSEMLRKIKESFSALDKKKQLMWLTVFEYVLIVILAGASLGFFYLLTMA
ncbi:hypothetical protein ACE1ET_19780 [Saccharicrinis sp. FJH62]|uniref:hypothetical protein n=1 Tax=Saccharicrinis sp. FJH62 TaxID=3344657 RepID=UPI0035D44712